MYTLDHSYGKKISDAFRTQELLRFEELADRLKICISVEPTPTGFTFECENRLLGHQFNLHAFGDSEGIQRHTETFEDPDPRYMEAWIKNAFALLNANDIPHRIIRNGNQAQFLFEKLSHLAFFTYLRDNDSIQTATLATLRVLNQNFPPPKPPEIALD